MLGENRPHPNTKPCVTKASALTKPQTIQLPAIRKPTTGKLFPSPVGNVMSNQPKCDKGKLFPKTNSPARDQTVSDLGTSSPAKFNALKRPCAQVVTNNCNFCERFKCVLVLGCHHGFCIECYPKLSLQRRGCPICMRLFQNQMKHMKHIKSRGGFPNPFLSKEPTGTEKGLIPCTTSGTKVKSFQNLFRQVQSCKRAKNIAQGALQSRLKNANESEPRSDKKVNLTVETTKGIETNKPKIIPSRSKAQFSLEEKTTFTGTPKPHPDGLGYSESKRSRVFEPQMKASSTGSDLTQKHKSKAKTKAKSKPGSQPKRKSQIKSVVKSRPYSSSRQTTHGSTSGPSAVDLVSWLSTASDARTRALNSKQGKYVTRGGSTSSRTPSHYKYKVASTMMTTAERQRRVKLLKKEAKTSKPVKLGVKKTGSPKSASRKRAREKSFDFNVDSMRTLDKKLKSKQKRIKRSYASHSSEQAMARKIPYSARVARKGAKKNASKVSSVSKSKLRIKDKSRIELNEMQRSNEIASSKPNVNVDPLSNGSRYGPSLITPKREFIGKLKQDVAQSFLADPESPENLKESAFQPPASGGIAHHVNPVVGHLDFSLADDQEILDPIDDLKLELTKMEGKDDDMFGFGSVLNNTHDFMVDFYAI